MSDTIQITDEDRAYDIIEGGDVEYCPVVSGKVIDVNRWSLTYESILMKIGEGTFWRARWREGSTEQQEQELGLSLTQVYHKVVPANIYVTKEN
jgi:hypothetical protein